MEYKYNDIANQYYIISDAIMKQEDAFTVGKIAFETKLPVWTIEDAIKKFRDSGVVRMVDNMFVVNKEWKINK